MMTARLGRPVRMTSRKTTNGRSFSYKPEKSGLYGLRSEKSVEIVAGNFTRTVGALCFAGTCVLAKEMLNDTPQSRARRLQA